MKVLVAVAGQEVKVQEITEGMTTLNELVGGSLECVQLGNGFILYCNHDGNSQDLAVNPHFSQGIIKGPFVIAKQEQGGRNIGLEENDIQYVMNSFIR